MKAAFLIGIIFVCGMSLSIIAQTRVQFIGCYSDVSPIPEGEIVGTGSFRISKHDGRYTASFAELISDSGEQNKPIAVGNFKIDQRTGRISFDLLLNRGGNPVIIRNVSGKITKTGIKMYWRGNGGEYGKSNPFLRRRAHDCK